MKRHKARFLFVLVASVSIITSTSGYIAANAKAQLVAPRLGAPIRTVATNGTGAIDQFLGECMEIIVGTDPADKRAPRSWMKEENWHVGLASVNLENATVVECSVSSIHRIPNPFINTGVLDSPGIARNAVSINARVPASIPPGTYDIHVSFKQSLPSTAGRVLPGSHQGPARSATMKAGGFLLSQPSCVLVPWVHDSLPSDPPGGNGSGPAGYHDPFSLVHLTDIHFGVNPSTRLQLPSSEQYTAPIAEALSILAPDLLIATGDLTRNPFKMQAEYEIAFDWFSSVGFPVVTSNGNHDQGNLGLWHYYFGPQTSIVNWAGMKIVSFNSVLPIGGETLSLICNVLNDAKNAETPIFLACHVPIMDVFGRQTSGSSAAIVDAMVRYNGTAILQGHNHYNLVMDGRKALHAYLAGGTMTGEMENACEFTTLSGEPLPPVNGPKLIITSTAGYDGRDNLQNAWEEYMPTTGFREITMESGRMVNYTYDMDGDGARDPSYAMPVFNPYNDAFKEELLNYSVDFNPSNASAGANCSIMNHLTESIPGARAAMVLPVNATHKWEVISPTGVQERSRIYNGTHVFLDLRLDVPAGTTSTVHLERLPI